MIPGCEALNTQGKVTHIAALVLKVFYGKLLTKTIILGLCRIIMQVHKSLPNWISIACNKMFGDWVPGSTIENGREPVRVVPSASHVVYQLTTGRRRGIVVPPKNSFPFRLPAPWIFQIGRVNNIIFYLIFSFFSLLFFYLFDFRLYFIIFRYS